MRLLFRRRDRTLAEQASPANKLESCRTNQNPLVTPRAPLCHASALPAELWPLGVEFGPGAFAHKPAPKGRLPATRGLDPNQARIVPQGESIGHRSHDPVGRP